jgi:hypothetical protein
MENPRRVQGDLGRLTDDEFHDLCMGFVAGGSIVVGDVGRLVCSYDLMDDGAAAALAIGKSAAETYSRPRRNHK